MTLSHRVEQILEALRPVFRRQATFEWFTLLLWGALLTSQAPAITSYLNAIGLSEGYYHRALHWFHSSAWSVDALCQCWGKWLATHPSGHRLNGQLVYVGDGIKVGKEGNKMPGVKRLHQESADVSKPEWIRGHYFGALGLLLGAGKAMFAVPIAVKLQDGIEAVESEKSTLVDKMAVLCVRLMPSGSYAVLDAYFAAANLLSRFRQHQLHLISRVRCTTVGYAPFCPLPGKRSRGRPRQWGTSVKLQELLTQVESFERQPLQLYGQTVTVNYWSIQLHWDTPNELVQFVLTQLPCGKQLILISSDVTLSAQAVIEAYGWRFKIEVCFRTLLHLLGGFCYRFWLKLMPSAPRWPKDLPLAEYQEPFRQQVARKVEAFERFVNLNAIALAILQVLSLEMSDSIWQQFPRWFRTLPQHGYPTEQVVRLTLQHQAAIILLRSQPALLWQKIIAGKATRSEPFWTEWLTS
ncbi:MAG: transposase [Microcystaceae cyanobacterium]